MLVDGHRIVLDLWIIIDKTTEKDMQIRTRSANDAKLEWVFE